MTISVIIPTYNRKEMVLNAIKSVLEQSSKPNEIIVVDDGSTDSTEDLFPIEGVIYHKIEHSGFPGKVRNTGASLSTSEYLAFLDSDDIWFKDKLQKQLEYFMSNSKCQILHTKERWIMNGKLISQKKRKHNTSGNIFKDSLQGCIMGPSTILMEKKLYLEYGGFSETIEVGEDYDLWLRICNSVDIDYIDDELITKFAGHGDQLSFKYGYIEPFKVDVLENLIKSGILSEENLSLALESLKVKYEIIINGCTKRKNIDAVHMYNNRKKSFLSKLRFKPI